MCSLGATHPIPLTVSHAAANASFLDNSHGDANIARPPGKERLTVPLEVISNPVANASQATISVISWTKAFVSLALVL